MSEYVLENDILTIFDATRDVITFNSAGPPVEYVKNVVTITTADGLPN